MTDLVEFVKFRKLINNVKFEDGWIVGHISIIDQNLISQLNKYEDRIDCITDVNEKHLLINDVIKQQIIKIKLATVANYFETFSEFVNANKDSIPSIFYIHEFDIYSSTKDKPDLFKEYESVIEFIKLLKLTADYYNDDFNLEFVFLSDQKLVFDVEYNYEDISKFKLNNVSKLYKHFTGDSFDITERVTIFKTELFNLLKNLISKDQVFVNLAEQWHELYTHYQKSYELYVKGFTIEKIRNELEQEKLEISKKIFDVLEGLSSKIIVLPIGYYLIISQFDYNGELLSKNYSLIIISLLFSILLTILLNNQIKHLEVLKVHIEDMSKKYDRVDLLENIVISLKTIHRNQKNILTYIIYGVWFVFLTSFIIFFIATFN